MATAADLIRRSLKLLGVLAAGESLRAEDQADGLTELNALLGTWANDGLNTFGKRVSSHVLTPSTSPHSIGSGGTINTTRPVRIDGAGITQVGQSAETPLRILTESEFQAIPDKTQTAAVPSALWFNGLYPLAHLWLWPVPTTAATLVLYSWTRITEFAAASDAVSLPDGYENALAHALALQLAPMFGVEPSGLLVQNAAESLTAIKRTNNKTELAEIDPAVLGGGAVNLYTGGA